MLPTSTWINTCIPAIKKKGPIIRQFIYNKEMMSWKWCQGSILEVFKLNIKNNWVPDFYSSQSLKQMNKYTCKEHM